MAQFEIADNKWIRKAGSSDKLIELKTITEIHCHHSGDPILFGGEKPHFIKLLALKETCLVLEYEYNDKANFSEDSTFLQHLYNEILNSATD